MGEVASRELRNNPPGLLRRVEAGEQVVITVDGRPVAVLAPNTVRPRWMPRNEFVRRFADEILARAARRPQTKNGVADSQVSDACI